jgi:hypothetical protein
MTANLPPEQPTKAADCRIIIDIDTTDLVTGPDDFDSIPELINAICVAVEDYVAEDRYEVFGTDLPETGYAMPPHPPPEVTQLWSSHGTHWVRSTSRPGTWDSGNDSMHWYSLLATTWWLSTIPPDNEKASTT